MKSTSSAYREEVLRLLTKEANRMAHALNLPEDLPIVETNLVSAHITPPRMAQAMKALGTVTTSNYFYIPFSGSKFSVVRTHLQAEYNLLQKEYLWPMSRMDTNAAYQAAVQILNAAKVNVQALTNACHATIRAFTPEGTKGKHFVPVYWVSWGQEGAPVASVELFEPTKTVRQLHVNKPEYILRKPLNIADVDSLLSETNLPGTAMTNRTPTKTLQRP